MSGDANHTDKLIWKMWDASNAIAAFSVIQSIGLVVGLGTSSGLNERVGSGFMGLGLAVGVSAIAGFLHAFAVWGIGRAAIALLPPEAPVSVWRGATGLRLAAIIVFASLATLASVAVWLAHHLRG